jgi:hypothetical protein
MYVHIKLQACGKSEKDLMPIINRIEKTSYTPIKASIRYFLFVGKGRIFFFYRYKISLKYIKVCVIDLLSI